MYKRSVELLREGIEEGAFPSASYAIGKGNDIYLCDVMGYSAVYPEKVVADIHTLYDMASLTKLIAPTMIALKLIEEGKLTLLDTLQMYYDMSCAVPGREQVNILQLMTHTSGITPHIPLYNKISDPKDRYKAILQSDPYCKPGEQVYYSCMGYMLLAGILEEIGGKPLDELAKEYVFEPLGMKNTCYNPTNSNVVTTEYSGLHKEYIKGHVHDENAYFLGGVSGNAGIFSDICDMTIFARMLALHGKLDGQSYISKRTFDVSVKNYTPGKNEARGLGFQLKPDNGGCACGDLFSVGSYGHTGFTGTSLYVDSETGLWAVLLTNAVHYGRDKTKFFRYRRAFYNTVAAEGTKSLL